jgi:integrase/recombinase XerD
MEGCDAWRLLLGYAQARTGKAPNRLDLADLDATLISAFLEHLETERRNSVRTRNARLAAIRSFFHYAALHHPEHAGLIAAVLAIPTKRRERREVSYLTGPEVEALVDSPDIRTWIGRKDHVLLAVAVQTGLRASEFTGLRNQDVELGTGAHVRCVERAGKNARPRWTVSASLSCGSGCKSGAVGLTTCCSRPAGTADSVATPSGVWSPSTPSPPNGAAHP